MRPTTIERLNQAFASFSKQLRELLIEEAARAHVRGDILAHAKLGLEPDELHVTQAALDYSRSYGEMLREEGASIISGKKVPWLADMEAEERNRVHDIIQQGIDEGKYPGVKERVKGGYPEGTIANDLEGFFSDRKSHASTVARTETKRIQNEGALGRYTERGYETVKVLDDEGPNSCAACAAANGQDWTVEYAQDHELEHPNCVRDFAPIVTGFPYTPEDAARLGLKAKRE